MSTPLFRREAIDYQRQHRQWGDVLVVQSVSSKFLSWFLCATIILIGAFLCVAPYARKQTVQGYLVPAAGTAKIFATTEGVIQQVFVRQGQEVHKGQPLLQIGTAQVTAEGTNVQAEILKVLRSQQQSLTRQIGDEAARERSERNRLDASLLSMAGEENNVKMRMENQHARIDLSEKLVKAASELRDKGYISNVESIRRKADVLEQKQSLISLDQQLLKLQTQMMENRNTLEQLPTTINEKTQILRNELANTEQRISETISKQAYSLEAPVDGRISLLVAAPGQAADPKRVQMEIIPTGSTLRAELFVPARAIGFITPGEKVRLLYDAFPYQEYGTYAGVVTNVSQTMQNAADASGPIHLEQSTYKVIAALDRTDIDAHGKTLILQPDMTLRADIILEKRPLIRWLLEPLLGTRM